MAIAADGDTLVVDASAIVEALLGTDTGLSARGLMRGKRLHAPAHLDAEVLSALGRLHRAGELEETTVVAALAQLAAAPIARHALAALLAGAWQRRASFRLLDGLYVELAESLSSALLTSDARLARSTARAELVGD